MSPAGFEEVVAGSGHQGSAVMVHAPCCCCCCCGLLWMTVDGDGDCGSVSAVCEWWPSTFHVAYIWRETSSQVD